MRYGNAASPRYTMSKRLSVRYGYVPVLVLRIWLLLTCVVFCCPEKYTLLRTFYRKGVLYVCLLLG